MASPTVTVPLETLAEAVRALQRLLDEALEPDRSQRPRLQLVARVQLVGDDEKTDDKT